MSRAHHLFAVLLTLVYCELALASYQFPFEASTPISSNRTHIWHHPFSEDHYIRVHECKLCPGADLWSGYFHSISENVAIFFVFARAENNPETAPLALWTNGGPGASALSLAFSRATGCILQNDYRGMRLQYTREGKKRWNENVNVVFIEQPLGTGFSRGHGRGEEDTRIGAEYIYEFIQIVLARHSKIPHVSLHTLSYGGHFIPEWAKRIVDENERVRKGESNNPIVPLKSVTMGNAWFGADEQYLSRYDLFCNPPHNMADPYLASMTPLLGPTECKRVSAHRTTCADHLKRCRQHPADNCAAAHLWCLTSLLFFADQTGRMLFDVSEFSTNQNGYNTYPELSRYLNFRPVQVALGVIGPEESPRKWVYYNTRVSDLHTLAGDHVRRTDTLLPAITDAGVDMLIYEGTLDYVCGIQGVREVIEGQKLIEGQILRELKDWKHGSGRYCCSAKSKMSNSGRFCYLEIHGQGHCIAVEYDEWPRIFESWVLEGSV